MGGYLPILNEINTARDMITEFRGYNHNLRILENEFDGMANMSSNCYPVFSPRSTRGILTQLTNPHGLTAKNNLFWVNGDQLFYNGVAVEGLVLQDNEKSFVSMGAYLLIWPDKVYFNTKDLTYGPLEAEIAITGDIICTLTKADGTDFGSPTVSTTEPVDPDDGALWLDTSENTHVLKVYSSTSSTWLPVATTYVKIASENIGAQFKQWDGVTISGMSESKLNGEFILYGAAEDYIIVTGLIDQVVTQIGGLTISRKVPDMDFVTECNNRVWGCSSEKHEIYCCVLGDPFNWHRDMGVSTDSYSTTVGSDGDFTGACTYGGAVCCWKEDWLHKIAGYKPGNFQLTSVACRGVEKGSEKSLVNVNERLYYKSRNTICMYDGSLPAEIGMPLGNIRYHHAIAGGVGNKYYISMIDYDSISGPIYNGVPHMFVFDDQLQMWHREDNTRALAFACHEGELFFIDADTNRIMTVGGRISVHRGGIQYDLENGGIEDPFEWYAESGEFGLAMPDNKFISRLNLRMDVATGQITISIQYDSSGTWEQHSILTTPKLRTFVVPIIPRRCDHLRIKISGTGDCKLYSIAKTVEEGSD